MPGRKLIWRAASDKKKHAALLTRSSSQAVPSLTLGINFFFGDISQLHSSFYSFIHSSYNRH